MEEQKTHKLTLSEQVKSAERDKYLAEAEKAKSEKIKIDKEINRYKYFLTRTEIFTILAAIPIFWFYYEFLAKPIFDRDNILNSLENSKQKKSLDILSKSLDSQKMVIKRKSKVIYNDSVNNHELLIALNNEQISLQKATSHITFLTTLTRKSKSQKQILAAQEKLQKINDSLLNAARIGESPYRVETTFAFRCNGESIYPTLKFIILTENPNFEGKQLIYHPVRDNRVAYSARLAVGCPFVLKVDDKRYKLKNGDFHFKTSGDVNAQGEQYLLELVEIKKK